MSDNQPSTPASPDPAGVERTATGEIKDQTQTTTPTATTPQTTTTTEGAPPESKPSLVNQDTRSVANQTQAGAPEKYEAFAVPDGYTLDEAVAGEIQPIFKAMNLSQGDAQKLVDFYVSKTTDSHNQPYKLWQEVQEKWVNEVKADPVIGPRLKEVTNTISRAVDVVAGANPALAREFREAMDYTGAGNNPAFIRMFYRMAQMMSEGGHVAGKGPSPAGQERQGQVTSAAKAMYPNLP